MIDSNKIGSLLGVIFKAVYLLLVGERRPFYTAFDRQLL